MNPGGIIVTMDEVQSYPSQKIYTEVSVQSKSSLSTTLDLLLVISSKNTEWLKLKYPPDKMQFLDNRVRFLYPKFLGLCGRDPATILKL